MLEVIVVKVTQYMLVYSLQLIAFAILFNALFAGTSVKEFSTFILSILYLLESSLGQFNFQYIWGYTVERDMIIGLIFYVVFILLNMIILINLLIALLSTLY